MMGHKRTLVIGDIHGNVNALNDALEASSFNIDEDRIICLGDYVDGWEHSFEVVRVLLSIKNQSKFDNVFLMGNHDMWFRDILQKDLHRFHDEEFIKDKYSSWYEKYGRDTYASYAVYASSFIEIHRETFFNKLKYYHIENNTLFVHAGFLLDLGFAETVRTNRKELLWDRSLYRTAYQIYLRDKILREKGQQETQMNFGGFDAIFIGHTPTTINDIYFPVKMANVINLDQGCKKKGRLTIWELETGRYYQNSLS